MEEIAVVRAEHVFKRGKWQGIKMEGVESIIRSIRSNIEFKPRNRVEFDPTYKQIIPYLIFKAKERYLLTQRLAHSKSEPRLHHLYSLGLGGHIERGDDSEDLIEAGLWREWKEEISYSGKINHRLIGLIYDESTEVSQVHLGFFYLLEGDSEWIRIREAEKLKGRLLPLSIIKGYSDRMENWSRIVCEYLSKTELKG